MLDCDHTPTILTGSRGSNGTSRVTVCVKCGQFDIHAEKDGVNFSETFSLYGSYELLAASQAHRLMTTPDAESANRRIWKPIDLAHERLYHVIRSWDVKDDSGTHNHKDNHIVAAQSPSHAAALVEATYEEAYKADERIVFHHSQGFPLNVLQPLSWSANGIQLLNMEFDEGLFVPAEYRCPQCQFRLSKRIIADDLGAVGIDPNAEPEQCPNDSTMMVRVSWREACAEAGEIAAAWMKRARQLEESWPTDAAMPVDDRDVPAERDFLTAMEHHHVWERDYEQPTYDTNPECHAVKCQCGATGWQSEGEEEVHDVVGPTEDSATSN